MHNRRHEIEALLDAVGPVALMGVLEPIMERRGVAGYGELARAMGYAFSDAWGLFHLLHDDPYAARELVRALSLSAEEQQAVALAVLGR